MVGARWSRWPIPAIAAVREGRIQIVPERFDQIYYQWMENIRDWPISRQLWWGHRIPVWYCDTCGEQTVEVETPQHCAHCGSDVDQAGRGCAGHLVLIGVVAFFDPGLAGRYRGFPAFLPDQRAGNRLRHHLFLGGTHDLHGYLPDG